MATQRQTLTAERATSVATAWGGAFLGAGATLFTIAIIIQVVAYGQPVPTGPNGEATIADYATHMLAHWELVRGIWLIEMAGDLFVALGGFLLRHRRISWSRLPSAVAWLAVAIGATVLAIMHAFIVGSYRAAAAAYAQEPALFTALQGGATIWFYAGAAVLLAGLTGAFTVEASAPDRVIPRWTAILGVVLAGVAAIVAIAMLTGSVAFVEMLTSSALFVIAFGSVLFTYPLAALLGVAIWKRTRGTRQADSAGKEETCVDS